MSDIESQIATKLDFFLEKINEGLIEELVDGFFTEDCIVTGSDVPFLCGRQQAINVFTQIRTMYERLDFELKEVREGSGDLHYGIVQTGAKLKDGTYSYLKSLVIFRKTDKGLLCETDFFAAGAFDE